MDAATFDAAIERWLHRQADYLGSSYHVQIKLWSSEVEIAELTAAELTGWVIIDWQHRGRGLSAKRALPVANNPPNVACLLNAIHPDLLHVQVQVVMAPDADWPEAYQQHSLAPDLMPVLDAGHAVALNISAERDHDEWRLTRVHQPPDDENIDDF
ncbi:MAG: hypothetical protein M1434_04300 [Chloroflexi bacterium]|nr:hypothetical protein [Chloroflexota bacterium]MCL5273954.1 hypothetical protein [Chloroflexota bacterium]